MPLIDDPLAGGSEPGAWADALRHSVNISIIEPTGRTKALSAGNPCFPTGANLPEPDRQLPVSQSGSGLLFQRQAHGENL